jgi:pilus assembly protein CpaF
MATEIEKLVAAFQDPGVSELMINDDGSVYVERAGAALEQVPAKAGPNDIAALLKALVGDTGGFGPQRPYADLSAADGSRVHVIAPPLVRGGVCVTIRKRPARRPTLEELVQAGSLTEGCAGFLDFAVHHQKNVIIVGGTSSGKTTLLSALAARINPKSRILVLEDTPELALPQSHVMYLRTRLRDTQGAPDVTLADLLVNTLRMRPDRIIVGEVRGPEASDMLQAMNVGQEGVLSTLHANSCREALQRLETLVLMAGLDMPLKAVRNNIALAVDLIVFMSRLSDGTRRVIQVAEITGIEVENITMADLFKTDSRKGPGGVSFALRPTGAMPRFYDQLRQQGFEPPLDFFQN